MHTGIGDAARVCPGFHSPADKVGLACRVGVIASMALRFLGKTSLAGLEPLQFGDRPVLASYDRLRDALRARAGAAAAEVLAEPIVTWRSGDNEGSVSWYAEGVGDPAPLAAIAPDRRHALEEQLRTVLASLVPLLRDAELGPLLQRALDSGVGGRYPDRGRARRSGGLGAGAGGRALAGGPDGGAGGLSARPVPCRHCGRPPPVRRRRRSRRCRRPRRRPARRPPGQGRGRFRLPARRRRAAPGTGGWCRPRCWWPRCSWQSACGRARAWWRRASPNARTRCSCSTRRRHAMRCSARTRKTPRWNATSRNAAGRSAAMSA